MLDRKPQQTTPDRPERASGAQPDRTMLDRPERATPEQPDRTMLHKPKQTMYKLLSFLLRYPEGDEFWSGVDETRTYLEEDLPDSPARTWLLQTLDAWASCDPTELRREYIQTFDFREKTCLYVTAHEYGDSRERGVALIQLHQLYRLAGFEASTDELPDYLPWLLEFLAVKPDEVDTEDLERRIAQVCHRILDNLGDDSFYNTLFCAAIAVLPQVAYQGEGTTFPKRQKADLDELPYPMRYQCDTN